MGGDLGLLPPLPGQPGEDADGDRRRRSVEGVTALAQNSDPFTYFASRPIRVCEGVAIDDGTLSLGVLKRAAQRDMPTLIPRLFSETRDRPRTGRSSTSTDVAEATVTSISETKDGPSAPSRSRSTATTSASSTEIDAARRARRAHRRRLIRR